MSEPENSDPILGQFVQQVVHGHVGWRATQDAMALGHFLSKENKKSTEIN
jgi:hypothetical protein